MASATLRAMPSSLSSRLDGLGHLAGDAELVEQPPDVQPAPVHVVLGNAFLLTPWTEAKERVDCFTDRTSELGLSRGGSGWPRRWTAAIEMPIVLSSPWIRR